MYLGNAILRT